MLSVAQFYFKYGAMNEWEIDWKKVIKVIYNYEINRLNFLPVPLIRALM